MALRNAFENIATSAKQDTGNTSLGSIDAKTPALVNGSVPVTDTGFASRTTDVTVTGTITTQNLVPAGTATAGSAVELTVGGRQTLAVQVVGTYTGALSVQATLDGTTWVTLGGSVLQRVTTAAFSATIVSAAQDIWLVRAAGFAKVRITALAAVTGTATISERAVDGNTIASIDTGAVAISGTTSVNGSGTSSIAKAEDVAHATGDLGVPAWGVRSPATPTTPTSAAGDYGYILIGPEGKLVMEGTGATDLQWQFSNSTTSTADLVVKAAAAAGIRNYVTDVAMSNSSTTEVVVQIKDGATVIWQALIPAKGTVVQRFTSPLKGTAATAVNVAALVATTTVYVSVSGYIGV